MKTLSAISSFIEEFEADEASPKLSTIGFNYVSTIANTRSAFTFLIIVFLLHFYICIVKILFSKYWECNNWFIKWTNNVIKRIFNMLTFGYYIRNAIELTQFILISSINEIYEWSIKDSKRLTSFVFSIFMIVLFFFGLSIIQCLTYSSYKLKDNEHNKLGELFEGLKNNKRSRFYITVLLLRRFIFVTILIVLSTIPSRALIGILSPLQILYLWLVVYLKPYKEIKWNIIEIINEVYFSLLFLSLLYLNTRTEWISLITNIYMWILASNTIVSFLIIFS